MAVRPPRFNASVFTRAIRHLHQGGNYSPEMLNDAPFLALIDETNKVLQKAFDAGIADNIPPESMIKMLTEDIFLFSGLKTHAQLKELSQLLLTPQGKIKPWNEFRIEAMQLHKLYNEQYLEAEYQFATGSALMAARWSDQESGGDRFNLQYRTAGDDKVRPKHRELDMITLPTSDSFWNLYYPPNGWRCRCTTVQVRIGKYPLSNSPEAIAKGESATTNINKSGINTDAIFRFNPGKDKIIFPDKHPYKQASAKATSVVKALPKTRAKSKVYSITSEIKNINDLSSSFAEFANKFPDYFASGFKRIDFERKASNNGSTDRRGNIWLSADRVKKVISGMNNIRKGIATTLDEEDALSTLWHEITHNRNPIPTILTTKQRSYMELANEYVSRKTLPQFLNDLGGDIQNISLLSNRTSTGYNTMVRNYQKLVEITGADESKVLDSVRDHLFNQSYTDQATGLIKAITKNSAIKEGTIKKAVTRCDGLSESGYEKFLKSLFPNK